MDQCDQVTPPTEDREVFLTPKSGQEEAMTSATEKQNEPVVVRPDTVSLTYRARPEERAVPKRAPRKRSRSRPRRPTQFAPRPFRFTIRNSIFVQVWSLIPPWVILAKGLLALIVQTRRCRSGSYFQVYRTVIQASSRSQTLRLPKGLAGQERGCHGPPQIHRL